ncbi:MAG: NINE protein [Lachnospiraceae bacterium]|nr:NINE protein [Lachnospiraceae bacterium]
MLSKNVKNVESEESVDIRQMIVLEEELKDLKQQYGLEDKNKWWIRLGDRIARGTDRKGKRVKRKTYIRLALTSGWLCGSHRFYSGQKLLGSLYALFCWTGIPFAMTLIDLMIVLPMQSDEYGMIEV